MVNADIKPKIVKLPKRKVFLYKKAEFRKTADDLDLLTMNSLMKLFVNQTLMSLEPLQRHCPQIYGRKYTIQNDFL